ncbi:MAG: hypothetical protein ACLQQ4_17670 [Bacteroidia bacterium]
MITNYYVPHLIKKETIVNLHFPGKDVLHSKNEKRQRKADAEKAMILGNTYMSTVPGKTYKTNVMIIFKDDEGVKQVETAIRAVTDTGVVLNAGMQIPIHRIFRVKV